MIFGFIIMIVLPQNNDKKVIEITVIFPLILCGFAYSFYASGLWPSIPYVVDKQVLGSAYGITTAIQNIGLTTGPLLVALVVDESIDGYNYRLVNLMQIGEVAIGLLFGILLWIYDLRQGGGVLSANSEEAAKKYIKVLTYRQKELRERLNDE